MTDEEKEMITIDSSVHFEDSGTHFAGRVVEVTQHQTQAIVSLTHCGGVRIQKPWQYAHMIVPIRRLCEGSR